MCCFKDQFASLIHDKLPLSKFVDTCNVTILLRIHLLRFNELIFLRAF